MFEIEIVEQKWLKEHNGMGKNTHTHTHRIGAVEIKMWNIEPIPS